MNSSDVLLPFANAARDWYSFGFSVIPIVPGTKLPAVKWDPWLTDLSQETIATHWAKHPDHEIGFIVGDNIIVFDADSPVSITALAILEETFDLTPNLSVTTAKGLHHYFKRTADTYARSDSHSTEQHPERIDVKTGRALVILPPSTGKVVDIDECEHASALTEAPQSFIDAVSRHNGREAPRRAAVNVASPRTLPADMDQATARLNAMLQHVDPDCGYEDWLHVLMAICHETGGSEEGLDLVIAWSSRGQKYCGEAEIRTKWRSFESYTGTPVTVGTLRNMVDANGFDWIDVCSRIEPEFDPSEFVTVHPDEKIIIASTARHISLVDYSLRGQGDQLAKEVSDQVLILGPIILMYQSTVIFAAPNTGKTLIILRLLIDAITQGKIDPSNVFYVNVDDTLNGLIVKVMLADKYGFHMLAEGYNGFRADALLGILADLVNNGHAKGTILILDTLKKFTDLMDKRMSSRFGTAIRCFVLKGGTCISLAHTNKHRNSDGKPVYAGTTDIIDDADCAYLMYEVGIDVDDETKTIIFENVKSRGNVAKQASYRYSIAEDLQYLDIIDSVEPVNDNELVTLKQSKELRSDAGIVDVIIACIRDGINTKMKLAETAAMRSGVSKRAVLRLIEKYAGTDPAVHKWDYTLRDRGAKMFGLLDPNTTSSDPVGKP